MKSSLTSRIEKADLNETVVYARQKLLQVFHAAGYAEDFKNKSVTILRNTEFPFQRVVLPNREYISHDFLNYVLSDLNIDEERFFRRLGG